MIFLHSKFKIFERQSFMRANRQFHLSALPRYILTARLPYETPVKTPQKILPMIETVRYVHFVLRLKKIRPDVSTALAKYISEFKRHK